MPSSYGVWGTSRLGRYPISPLLVCIMYRWGFILGCTNEGLLVCHRNRWIIWLPTVKIWLYLVLEIAILYPSWTYLTLILIGSSCCGWIPSWLYSTSNYVMNFPTCTVTITFYTQNSHVWYVLHGVRLTSSEIHIWSSCFDTSAWTQVTVVTWGFARRGSFRTSVSCITYIN